MLHVRKFIALIVLLAAIIFLNACGSSNPHSTGSTSSGTSGSGGGSGSGTSNAVPGFGEGTGSSGQTSPAKFLYANPLPGGGPFAAMIQSNGTLTAAQSASVNNNDPMTIAIDPSGSFLFQTALPNGAPDGNAVPGGIYAYVIDSSNGNLSIAPGSPYLTTIPFYADVVDQQGKFLYAFGFGGLYAFSIEPGTGTLTQIAGSPFAAVAPSSAGFPTPATLMVLDQTNKFLYVSTSAGVSAYTINQSTGQLAPIAGSPFGSGVTNSWTIVITPNNSYLYQLQSQNSTNIYGYSVNQTSGALTVLSNSPFSAGKCGSLVPSGTIGIPGPDNMTIASAGKFMYDNCGIYSIDGTTGTLAQVSSSGPGDWPVIDPTGTFLWAIGSDQQACFHCDIDVAVYQVNPHDGSLTLVPNSFFLLTNSEVGGVNSLAITK
jgi:6-phosphogluconolactonase (cycloisomerase 2 family)